MKWVLSSFEVSFFAVRKLHAFLLLPPEMDPKAPPEHWAEVGTGQPIPSQISISLQTFCTPDPTHHYLFNRTLFPAPEGRMAWSAETVESLPHARNVFTHSPKSNFSQLSPAAFMCQV